jgi:hypothetical protein
MSCRGGTTGRAAGCPARVLRGLVDGRGAIGVPGVSPGAAGREGGSGRAGPGIGVPGVAPAEAVGAGAPGATTCVGACGILGVAPGAVTAAGGVVAGLAGPAGLGFGVNGAGRAGRSCADAGRSAGVPGRDGSCGMGRAGMGVDGATRGAGGSGRAGIATFREPAVWPDASGGCTTLPPPNGGRRGLNVGAGRSDCSGTVGGAASAAPDAAVVTVGGGVAGVAGAAGWGIGSAESSGEGAAVVSRAGGRTGVFRGGRRTRGDSGAAAVAGVSADELGSPFLWVSGAASAGSPYEGGFASPVSRRRSSRATSSSSELECVFFSCTPNSGSSSRMTPGFTSSSRASSLTLTLLIEKTASITP